MLTLSIVTIVTFVVTIVTVSIFIVSRINRSYQKVFICFIQSSLKITKNAFYFILKTLFVLMIFKFFSSLFGHVEEAA